MKPLRTTLSTTSKQRGAVLMVMLVIMIMGVSFLLVSALSKVTLQNARDEKSSEILAQAKEVVIGYAVSGGSRPGELPLQDKLVTPTEEAGTTDGHPNYNGIQDGCSGSNYCLGRLPWQTLKMSIGTPSENDPTGFMPWYAVSGNLVDTTVTLNSELLNTDNVVHPPNNYPVPPHPWLTVRDMDGNVLSDRVAFVIIIPGPALPGQSRPAASIVPPVSLGGGDQYLDKIGLPPGCNPNPPTPTCPNIYKNYGANNEFITGAEHRWIDDLANPGKQIEDPYYNFNDKLIYVTIDELMPLIEKRIAREVKACLDSYAIASNNKYPWAALVTDITNYKGVNGTRFGRIASVPSNALTNDPTISNFLDLLNSLQTALNTYNSARNAPNLTALKDAGHLLKDASDPAPSGISSTVAHKAEDAGDTAKDLSTPTPSASDLLSIQTDLSSTYSGLNSDGIIDGSMGGVWNCSLLNTAGNYWNDWRDLVFYQIANGNQPGATPNCTGANCLSITTTTPLPGNGNFRTTVVVAGKVLTGQARAVAADKQTLSNYLEGLNQTGKAPSPTTTSFESYKPSESNYQTINDLVLCADGKINCK